MFVRQTEQKPKELYYADSLLTQPTTSQSVFANLAGGFASSMAVVGDVENLLSDQPQGNVFRDVAESVQIMNQTPSIGWKQGAANSLANMIGYGLNPIVWGFGKIGGMAAEAAIGAASKVAPEAVNVFMRRPLAEVFGEPLGKYIPSVAESGKYLAAGEGTPLTSAMLGEKYASAFGTFSGAGAPAAWYENYNADTKHIDWGGGASDMAKMGAFGLAIESIPFAWGVLRSKVSRAADKSPAELTMADYDKALADGLISPDEHAWMKDYTENPLDSQNLKQRASKILADNDVNINTASHQVPVDIVKPEDMENLNSALLDQSLADMPPELRTALSDYIVHNGVDNLRENPKLLDGLRGYRDFIDEKLASKNEKLSQADDMLDKHMLKSMTDNMPLSQKELLKTMKKYGAESSHVKNMPISIPDTVKTNLKKLSDIRTLEFKSKQLFKDYEKTGNQEAYSKMKDIHQQMEDVKQSIPEIMTPKQELQHLRSKLLTEKGLPKNWQRSANYHRLVDLAHVWENAKTLLDRVHHEGRYEIQETYRNLANQVLSMTDSNVGRFANRDNVVNYMRDRVKAKALKVKPDTAMNIKVAEQSEVPENAKELLEVNEAEIAKIGSADLAKEFQQTAAKFKDFKNNEAVFKSLIQCVMGGMNG